MSAGPEPLTSLLRRELAIAASGAGKLSRALWEMNRVLRDALQPDVKDDKMALNEEESGTETRNPSGVTPFLPSLVEPSSLRRDYD